MSGRLLSTAVVLHTPDPVLGESLVEAARRAGAEPQLVTDAATFEPALRRTFPMLAVIDLKSSENWRLVLQRCRANPQIDHTPIYALISPAIEERKATATQDLDGLWPRAEAADHLVRAVQRHLEPPIRYPAGWNEAVSREARQGIIEFNQGHYFEQHEYFEEAWKAEARPIRDLYQGILQIGLAFLQMERNNWRGAIKMFQRGFPYLSDLPPVCRGIHLAPFRASVTDIYADVMALGPEAMDEFDSKRLPRLETGDHPHTPITRL